MCINAQPSSATDNNVDAFRHVFNNRDCQFILFWVKFDLRNTRCPGDFIC